jgi:hypothetical protein
MSGLFNRGKVKNEVHYSTTVKMELPYINEAIASARQIYNSSTSKYELYNSLVKWDAEIYGAVDTKSTFVAKIISGFSVLSGDTKTEAELELQEDLEQFYLKIRPYYYDIAFKVIKDGNAVYLIDIGEQGFKSLIALPMRALTCVEKEEQIMTTTDSMDTLNQPSKPEIYILSEGTGSQTLYRAGQIAHFDMGRKEEVVDLKGRLTRNIWNESLLESLRSKMLWKEAIIINDMIWRERNVPREHHQLPAAQFNPENYPGKTPAERYSAAKKSAETTVLGYAKTLTNIDKEQFMKPDQAYVTLDNVKITMVGPVGTHTDPNELLYQIDDAIYAVLAPKSTISGAARSSYSAEAAIMLYTTVKAERVAETIAYKLVDLSKRHLNTLKDRKWTSEDLNKIVPKFNKILEKHAIVRDTVLLLESGAFSPTEIRDMMGYDKLTKADIEEITEYRKFLTAETRRHIASPAEVTTTRKRATRDAPSNITTHSADQQALT